MSEATWDRHGHRKFPSAPPTQPQAFSFIPKKVSSLVPSAGPQTEVSLEVVPTTYSESPGATAFKAYSSLKILGVKHRNLHIGQAVQVIFKQVKIKDT